MVAFNRNLGFQQPTSVGRNLINPKNSALRPGNLPTMPRTEVGRLTGESPKTGGVDDKPNDKEAMADHYFDSSEDLAHYWAQHKSELKPGDRLPEKVYLANGQIGYRVFTVNESGGFDHSTIYPD